MLKRWYSYLNWASMTVCRNVHNASLSIQWYSTFSFDLTFWYLHLCVEQKNILKVGYILESNKWCSNSRNSVLRHNKEINRRKHLPIESFWYLKSISLNFCPWFMNWDWLMQINWIYCSETIIQIFCQTLWFSDVLLKFNEYSTFMNEFIRVWNSMYSNKCSFIVVKGSLNVWREG